MDPATIALIGSAVSAAGSAAGGILGRNKESRTDRRKRELIDDLLASVRGNGPFTDMFNTSEESFNKYYVQPAKKRFQREIAPQIQQAYIASGQHRGTGLEDTLTRAGVELDELLNQQYFNYMNQGNANKQNAINSILGSGSSNPNQSRGSAAQQGIAGYLASEGFGSDIGSILKGFQPKGTSINDTFVKPRSGYVNDQVYDPYTGIQQ